MPASTVHPGRWIAMCGTVVWVVGLVHILFPLLLFCLFFLFLGARGVFGGSIPYFPLTFSDSNAEDLLISRYHMFILFAIYDI